MRSQGDQEEGLAQFLNAHLRQEFAQRRNDPGGDLFHLPDGEAEALRQLTREHLHCPRSWLRRPGTESGYRSTSTRAQTHQA